MNTTTLCHRVRTIVVGIALAALSGASLFAGSGFFSADGKTVTFAPSGEQGCLIRVELESGKVERLSLGSDASKQEVLSVCRGADGKALFTTETGVFVFDSKGTRKLASPPAEAKSAMRDLAVAPDTARHVGDWMFVSAIKKEGDLTRRWFYARKPGQPDFQEVFCRRLRFASDGVFTASGRFFFVGEDDLWEGKFGGGAAEGDHSIDAVRVAPLAFLETDFGNAGAMYVREILVAGDFLYVTLQGHHLHEVVRVPVLDPPSYEVDLKANYRRQMEMLSKAEVIEELADEREWCLAAANVKGTEMIALTGPAGHANELWLWDYKTRRARSVAVLDEESEAKKK